MKNPFRTLKRIIAQYFETEYWYRFRKYYSFWYDKDERKYEITKNKARDVITSTWNGENDILSIMLLKIEHMFYNLKRYGNQLGFYIDSYHFLEKEATEQDKILFINQIFNKKPIEKNKEFWIGNEEKDNVTIHYYLVIEKNKTDYTIKVISRQKGNLDKYILGFETKNLKNIELQKIQKSLDDCNISINILDSLFIGEQTFVIDDMKTYTRLSPYMKSVARGLRRQLTDLLQLRRMIKKLNNMTDIDDKYYSMWSEEKDKELRSKKVVEARKLFEKDRKELYLKIANFMIDKGETWWD